MSKGAKKKGNAPTEIYIKQEAKLKQDRLIAMVPGEVGWFGIVDDSKGFIVVEDIIVPEQVVTGASVDYDNVGLGSLMEEYSDQLENIKYFGHSHYTMDAYFSSIDTEDFIEPMMETGINYLVCHVENKKGESETRLDQVNPIRIEDKECKLITLIPQHIVDWTTTEIEDNVTLQKTISKSSSYNVGTYSGKQVNSRQDVPKKGKAVWIDGQGTRREYEDGRLVSEEAAHKETRVGNIDSIELDLNEALLKDEYIPIDIEDEDEYFGDTEEETNNWKRLTGLDWYESGW